MGENVVGADAGLENLAARRGIYYQSFSIYKEVGGFFDYGPIGLKIKRNIEGMWRRVFIEEINSLEIESTLIMPEVVFKASGHLASFSDPVINCSKCKKPSRADKILEEYYEKRGDMNGGREVEGLDLKELESRILSLKIRCGYCGGEFARVEDFNMMFKTQIGSLGGELGYLRPETAQGIFVDFRNLRNVYGLKLPVAIGQVGKVFRNEISPRQHLLRLREFTQMELEVFFDPSAEQKSLGWVELGAVLGTEIEFLPKGGGAAEMKTLGQLLDDKLLPNRLFAFLLYLETRLFEHIGLGKELFRFRAIDKPPHYSGGNVDIEVKTSYGYIEVSGNAYRTDYDLSSHAKTSGADISVADENGKVVPHVVEASIGLDRLFFALLENSMRSDNEKGRAWLDLKESVAPYRYAIFPLQKDEGLVKESMNLAKAFTNNGIHNYYSDAGSIGKRYAKADEIGVPHAITVDFQTLQDGTVTVRDIRTTSQVRRKIEEIR